MTKTKKSKKQKTTRTTRKNDAKSRRRKDALLDEALAESFPASDQVELTEPGDRIGSSHRKARRKSVRR